MTEHLSRDEVVLTTEHVLDYLKVNLRTLYRLISAGKIPAFRVGRQWRFRRRDVDAWLDSHRVNVPRLTPLTRPPVVRPRVLIVDDDRTIREFLANALSLEAYDVDTVPDGRTALERLHTPGTTYDVMIVDLVMPGIDGIALIARVKMLKAHVAIIIITGCSSESSAVDAVNLGVKAYLTKPFQMPELLCATANALHLDNKEVH